MDDHRLHQSESSLTEKLQNTNAIKGNYEVQQLKQGVLKKRKTKLEKS
jgi:hypothetical protein